MRLNKRLVELGLSDSRRKADEAINQGRVTVNGKVASLGTVVNKDDTVQLGGKSGQNKQPIYVAFNKPVGYVCSHAAQGGSKTVFSLLPKSFAHLKIAGRLDSDSCGLLILSSDGDFVHVLTHPSSQKEKEYIVGLNKPLLAADLTRLKKGVVVEKETLTFHKITRLNPSTFRVILTEGKNRQIRNMFASLNYSVTHLQRIRVGKYELATLANGKHRVIQPNEVL